MPGLDKSGPMGQGSQTGRKMGRCRQENETLTEEWPRRGGGRRGLGRKMRFGGDLNVPGDGTIPGRRRGRGRQRN